MELHTHTQDLLEKEDGPGERACFEGNVKAIAKEQSQQEQGIIR